MKEKLTYSYMPTGKDGHGSIVKGGFLATQKELAIVTYTTLSELTCVYREG